MGSFRRILVGWDGSKDAEHALRSAVRLACEIEAEVVALSVLGAHPHAEATDEAEAEMVERRQEVANEIEAAVKHAGLRSPVRLRAETLAADNPAHALGRYASEHGFDLLVLGRHGLDRAAHPRIGRVTEYQIRHSVCPVLVVGAT